MSETAPDAVDEEAPGLWRGDSGELPEQTRRGLLHG